MGWFKSFVEWNKRICDRIEAALPVEFTRSLLYLHERMAAEVMLERDGQIILDVGGGHMNMIAKYRKPQSRTRILAMDILPEQIAGNDAVDTGFVADACRSIPLKDDSVDLIITRSVLEHLRENNQFFLESRRILRLGGKCIHVFPCRFAPFAIFNQIIPNRVARRLLLIFFPEYAEACGFRAYYRNCFSPSMQRKNIASALSVVDVRYRYYQAIYFKFFVPLYLVVILYDYLLYSLDVRPLACQMLLVVQKK